EEARNRIAQALNMSPRNVARYCKVVLYTPAAVQDACRDRQLPLVVAERVAWVGDDIKAAISRRLQHGEPPKDVVADFVSGKRRKYGDPVDLLLRGLRRALRHVEGRVEEQPRHVLRPRVPALQHAQRV